MKSRGRLARPHEQDDTARTRGDEFGRTLYQGAEEADRRIVDAVGEVAGKHGVPRAQVAGF